jgi:hypothetical protein
MKVSCRNKEVMQSVYLQKAELGGQGHCRGGGALVLNPGGGCCH